VSRELGKLSKKDGFPNMVFKDLPFYLKMRDGAKGLKFPLVIHALYI
jgi:hypothetical protein